MSHTLRARRPGARTATGLALAATMLTSVGVGAQSPAATTAPDAPASQAQPVERPGRDGHGGMGRGFDGRGMGQRGQGRGDMQGMGGRGQWFRDAARANAVTVTSVDGTSLALETADGWTRTIDTTGVALTRDGSTIALADVLVGERVRVVQTRNADGTYTVTGIEVQPTVVQGTVGTASADGFTIVGSDGTTTTVVVSAETTWSARGSTSVTIADATAGRDVAVSGALQADGSIAAAKVRLG